MVFTWIAMTFKDVLKKQQHTLVWGLLGQAVISSSRLKLGSLFKLVIQKATYNR